MTRVRRLRVATLNIHKGLSHFNRRMVIHELRDGLRALDADIVFLQEVQGLNQHHKLRFESCPPGGQHEFLAGEEWQHVYGRNAIYDHGHHGNAILSRFPFVSFENHDVSDHRFERRGLLHCVVAVPGWRRNLHCVCVHLSLHQRGGGRRAPTRACCRSSGSTAFTCAASTSPSRACTAASPGRCSRTTSRSAPS